jgi:hypothetical protein
LSNQAAVLCYVQQARRLKTALLLLLPLLYEELTLLLLLPLLYEELTP